jgi:hypothetical protein
VRRLAEEHLLTRELADLIDEGVALVEGAYGAGDLAMEESIEVGLGRRVSGGAGRSEEQVCGRQPGEPGAQVRGEGGGHAGWEAEVGDLELERGEARGEPVVEPVERRQAGAQLGRQVGEVGGAHGRRSVDQPGAHGNGLAAGREGVRQAWVPWPASFDPRDDLKAGARLGRCLQAPAGGRSSSPPTTRISRICAVSGGCSRRSLGTGGASMIW